MGRGAGLFRLGIDRFTWADCTCQIGCAQTSQHGDAQSERINPAEGRMKLVPKREPIIQQCVKRRAKSEEQR